jgi:uncharacterized membrane protein
MSENWHLYLMACLYIVAGLMHFIKPRIYLAIMPPYLPFAKALVGASGIAEIALGTGLLFRPTRHLAIYGILVMLLLFLMVHVHMLTDKKAGMGLPKWALLLRIPLQFALIYWAYIYIS